MLRIGLGYGSRFRNLFDDILVQSAPNLIRSMENKEAFDITSWPCSVRRCYVTCNGTGPRWRDILQLYAPGADGGENLQPRLAKTPRAMDGLHERIACTKAFVLPSKRDTNRGFGPPLIAFHSH